MNVSRIAVVVAAALAFFALVASGAAHRSGQIRSLAALFPVNPLLGGQVPPRTYRYANDDVSLFLQFDRPNAAEASALRYIGIAVKGTFCAEAQPGGANGGFTHYHRLTAPVYGQGHGGQPGEHTGFWLLWVAVDSFTAGDGRRVAPGVDYAFSPTPPPSCGADVPKPAFQAPGEHALTRAEIKQLVNFFHDNPFRGAQTPTRFYRWVNGDVLAFLEFDSADPEKATRLRYFGISERGKFCKQDQPTPDFTHFDRLTAPAAAKAVGGKAGQGGFWSLAVAADSFPMPWGQVTPGVDRKYALTPAPDCPKA